MLCGYAYNEEFDGFRGNANECDDNCLRFLFDLGMVIILSCFKMLVIVLCAEM